MSTLSLMLLSTPTLSALHPKKHVIVIGAGIAGLATAKQLQAAGLQVTVLEARPRSGGRIYTSDTWRDMPMDLGASWIHGHKNNPITTLANTIDAKRVETSYAKTQLHIASDLKARGVQTTQDKQMSLWVEAARKQASKLKQDISLQQAVDQYLINKRLSLEDKALLNFYLNSTYEQEYAGASTALSAQTVDEISEFAGGDMLFPQGYSQITHFLAKGLTMHFNQMVERLEYTASGVVAYTQQERYSADYAVVTLPLGVLKQANVQFAPPLPTAKQQAIKRLGVGLLNKTFLRFDKVFWSKQYDWHEYVSYDKGRWAEWVSFAKFGSPVLLGFNAAERAHQLELWSDERVVEDAMQVLRTMFGNSIPEPRAYQITRWASDPFARGSYSFNAVGSTPQDRKVLAQPLLNRVFWAGEATHEDYSGTVHGAYLSGLAAAQALLKLV